MNSYTGPGNDDDEDEEAKRSATDNSTLGEDLPRRSSMATFDIDQQFSEGDDDGDDDDEYEDRPLVLEGSVVKARKQKGIAVDRENRIVGVAIFIGTLAALIVFAVTSSGSTVPAPVVVAPFIEAVSADTDITLTSMATQQGPTNTTPAASALFETPSLDLLTCPLDTSDTYWNRLISNTAVGKYDSDRCGNVPNGRICQCLNPVLPVPRTGKLRSRWSLSFQRNLQLIADTVSTNATGTGDLDVVLLGDSITEHWLGTDLGTEYTTWSEHFQVYQELFQNKDNNSNATSGLALGIGGDNCPHLLYRLMNGEMAELSSNASSAALDPAVWWVLIGTNDYSAFCEAEEIVTGTVRIVQEILDRRPSATVVVNSILPRGYQWRLGPDWYKKLMVVNRQMECYAASQERVEFFNATDYFVEESTSEEGDDHIVRVNKTLMADAVHPSATGYRIWGQAIVDRVQEIKEQQRSKK
jgi:lysophospholipase L1-like esterase